MRIKTSKYKGVSKSRNKWRCYLRKNGVDISKSFDTEIEAAEFYNLHSEKPNRLKNKLICPVCKVEKDKSEFHPDGRKETGVCSVCKYCVSIQTSINNALKRMGLKRGKNSIEYLKIDRIIKLIEKGVLTKDEGREIYNRDNAIKCAFSIRLKSQKNNIAGNTLR